MKDMLVYDALTNEFIGDFENSRDFISNYIYTIDEFLKDKKKGLTNECSYDELVDDWRHIFFEDYCSSTEDDPSVWYWSEFHLIIDWWNLSDEEE